MPAAPSSPVDPAICHLLAAVEGVGGDRATVVSVLAGWLTRVPAVGCVTGW
jgi:hypothetical protein